MILVDDAHGVGVLGANGRGSLELENVSRERVIQCATLSKAFGAFGGIVLSSRVLRGKVLARSRSLAVRRIAAAAGGCGAGGVENFIHRQIAPQKIIRQRRGLRLQLRAAGWEILETSGPIVRLPVLLQAEERRLRRLLLAAGIYPPYLKYGAATHGTFRFRHFKRTHSRTAPKTRGRADGFYFSFTLNALDVEIFPKSPS